MLQQLYTGLDHTSLFGSYLSINDNFIFVSSNGYNIFNGAVTIYYNNITHNDDKIILVKHSVIYCPETLNSNFGIKTAATNKYLAISSIAYDIYEGIIYIYEFINNKWAKIRKINSVTRGILNGFGRNLFFLNNHSLFITNFYNNIYQFNYVHNIDLFTKTNVFSFMNSSERNFNITIKSDNINNLFITNLTNILTVFDLENNLVSYFKEETHYNCFYGSEIYIYSNSLFISCSLYYPFNNMLDDITSQIFIYSIIYDNNHVINLALNQIITVPDNNLYFGTNINVHDNTLIVPGKNTIYNYIKNNEWELTNKYSIPDSFVSFDYKVQIIGKYIIVGNYGFNELQGAIFSGYLNNDINPPPPNIDNISDTTVNNNGLVFKIMAILFLFVVGILAITTIMITCYFIVSLFSKNIDIKKKKKEEEEDSPYKVYSYIGYVETDDNLCSIPYPVYNSYNQYYYPNYNNNFQYDSQSYTPSSLSPLEKGKKQEINNDKEKVVSYKGFTYDSIQENYKEKIKPILDEIKKNNIK